MTDRQTDGKNNLSPNTKGEGNEIKMKSWHVCQFSNVILNKIRTEFLSFS